LNEQQNQLVLPEQSEGSPEAKRRRHSLSTSNWRTQRMPELTYRDALRAGMAEEMERDESVVLLGEDIGL
jgi:hypothetical protein